MKIKEGFLLSEVAGNYVVVKVGQTSVNFNSLISLNESSKYLWEALSRDEGAEIDELVSIILKEYDIDEKTARADILEFIDCLNNHGILE